MNGSNQRTVPVSDSGRMNLPVDMRRALGLDGAGHLVLTLVDGEIRITTQKQALMKVRRLAAAYKPRDEFASDQLVAERRREAVFEDVRVSDGNE